MGQNETQFRDGHQDTRDRSPQTNQQERCWTCRHQFQDDLRVLMRRQQPRNAL
jgi:hypothetical protein